VGNGGVVWVKLEGVADLLGVVFGDLVGRKFRGVIKVGKCVDWEGVPGGWAIYSDFTKGNTPL
jgi:hypothetical protein